MSVTAQRPADSRTCEIVYLWKLRTCLSWIISAFVIVPSLSRKITYFVTPWVFKREWCNVPVLFYSLKLPFKNIWLSLSHLPAFHKSEAIASTRGHYWFSWSCYRILSLSIAWLMATTLYEKVIKILAWKSFNFKMVCPTLRNTSMHVHRDWLTQQFVLVQNVNYGNK